MKIADELIQKNVEAIILGCTELPLVFPRYYPVPVINSLELMAKELIINYFKEKE